jgi:phosphoribosylaminoimidazole-succinocarboxamide synthase
LELVHSGKVRDLYADGDDIIMVASDRVSVYDVVLPTPIPGKGRVLTQLSLWWFGQLGDVIPNHVISGTDVPEEWAGRAIRCRRLTMLPVECIARGYLAGLGLASYRDTGAISGVRLPSGLGEGSRLPEPVFTPTTKAAAGHDEPMTYDEVAAIAGDSVAAGLRPWWWGPSYGAPPWRSTGVGRSWPLRAASSSPIPSWSSACSRTGR